MKSSNITKPDNMDLAQIDQLANKFNEVQNKNDMADVIKELFDKEKIYMITDLLPDEIKLFTRLYTISQIKNIKIYYKSLQVFAQLMLSKNRKSRTELLEAIKGIMNPTSLMHRLNPVNWGRRF